MMGRTTSNAVYGTSPKPAADNLSKPPRKTPNRLEPDRSELELPYRAAIMLRLLRLDGNLLDEEGTRRLPDGSAWFPAALRIIVQRATSRSQVLQAVQRQLKPVLHSELLEQAREIDLYGTFRNGQCGRYLLIFQSLGE